MDLQELKNHFLDLLHKNPHIPEEVKHEIVNSLPDLDKASVQELIRLLTELNEQLVVEYERMTEELQKLAKEAEEIAEGEKVAVDSAKIADLRGKLGLK